MAATIDLAVYTASGLATSALHSGVALLSYDGAASELSTREMYPVATCTRSYTKWLKIYISAPPTASVASFLAWGDGAVDTGTSLYAVSMTTGCTPTDASLLAGASNFDAFTASDAALDWDSSSYTAIGSIDNYLALQLLTDADVTTGSWTQETITYGWTEDESTCTATFTLDAMFSKRRRIGY